MASLSERVESIFRHLLGAFAQAVNNAFWNAIHALEKAISSAFHSSVSLCSRLLRKVGSGIKHVLRDISRGIYWAFSRTIGAILNACYKALWWTGSALLMFLLPMLVLCLILAFGYFSLRLVSWLLHKRRLRLLEEQRKRKDEEIQRRLDTRRERHRRLLLERARQFKAEQEQRAREQEARKLEDENRRLKEAQRMQEERQARRREQEAAEQTRRQAEALRYTQCKDWLHRADDALRNKDLMMEFPAFPRWDCPLTLNERYPCSPSPRLGTCRHRVKALYSVEAELEKALKHTRKKWHPDKFMRCPEGTREDLIASVTEFFQILESLYEEIRSHTS